MFFVNLQQEIDLSRQRHAGDLQEKRRWVRMLDNKDPSHWPVDDPLPSYGRGRELPGGRHRSLIHGHNMKDVIITGQLMGKGVCGGTGSGIKA
ncbi:hypothetical protein IFM89_029706 [Coptis chinensis]|uniref:Uncharacterized protein n=1 Tax=Coptis chinensis TaxID=261450 RepID=A0A835IHC4_9MAGN|nr:hypothetical protein IFM89_029706 [Coptis chinensis]